MNIRRAYSSTPPSKLKWPKRIAKGIAIMVAPTYIGATIYAQSDREFKRFFRENVPGADVCLRTHKEIAYNLGRFVDYVRGIEKEHLTEKDGIVLIEEGRISEESVLKTLEKKPEPAPSKTQEEIEREAAKKKMQEFVVMIKEIAKLNDVGGLNGSLVQVDKSVEELVKDGAVDEGFKELSKQFLELIKNQMNLVEQARKGEMSELTKYYENQKIQLATEIETVMMDELKKQASLYQENMTKQLEKQKKEMEADFKRRVRKQVAEERNGQLSKLSELELELKVLEMKVKEENDLTKHLNESSKKLLFANSILNAIENPTRVNFSVPLNGLKNECSTEFVKEIVKEIPEEVSNAGVMSEQSLIDGFREIIPRVRRVAFIPENNSSLKNHAFSFLFSSLVFKLHGNVEGKEVDCILARSENWISKGNLEMATRELNSLKGWPRLMALEWIKEARKTLQVKQAMSAIQSHLQMNQLGLI
ncbi:Mitochondrial inner membrane protein Mitofilin domain-containing protein [Rozella allomycis CSF55]|uniref:MICOS complex subunit MIC60 n=1 Tax=Rozella allomycis (strain CSF55) TaxID=988480 RepID=A0A075AU50_ROZAC|nr:Mitochondrial inner membrane protein Mitofilin domain-containing protein [Rozella allomycis CSF55]|eukprot:EPZ32052.1 Mitochondrial inner membrane protein Mitofilin domain-containing protein [Rozella allomycis CSF55]